MKTKKLVVSAVMLAIATVLSFFQPFQLPFGGGITLASMMPLVIIAYIYGTKWGLLSGFVYSVLQMILGMKGVAALFLPGESQMAVPAALGVCLFDYILSSTMLGFGGIFKGKFKNSATEICLGSIVALFLKYVMHVISGALFYGMWAEWFFTQEGFYAIGSKILNTFSGTELSIVYSLFYNALYMFPEIIITAIVTPIVYKAIEKSNLAS